MIDFGKILSNDKEIVKYFNEHLIDIIAEIDIDPFLKENIPDYMTPTQLVVRAQWGYGADRISIHNGILKSTKILYPYLTDFIYSAIWNCQFPSKCLPYIQKYGCKLKSNLKPISGLSSVSKISERIILFWPISRS